MPPVIETEIAALRSATDDSPAGPLFQSDYAEYDLTSLESTLDCSLATGSFVTTRHYLCCA
jgi:hypothetical protein